MWIALSLLFLLFGGMLAFSLGERLCFCKNGKISLPRLDLFSAAFLCVSIVLGGTFLYGNKLHLPIYTWVIILILLWGLFYFPPKNWTKLQKSLFQFALCTIGVFGVLLPPPQADLLYWLFGGLLILAWFIGWRIFSSFDKYPMTSSIVSTGWFVSLLVVYLMFKEFPPEISLFAAILGIPVYVILRKRAAYGIFSLSLFTNEITGFVWGGIWTICLLQADISILLLVYGYYLMEMCVLLIKYLKKRPMETLLMQALPNDKRRRKAISTVFFHVIVLGFLAATLTAFDTDPRITIYASVVFSFIICFNLYNHLKDLDHPIGTWKEIFSELKKGVSSLPKASKDFAKEVKSSLKTHSRKKKSVHKKSVIKKKGTKKKK